MNLKQKYNKLFNGKPKSNDSLLTEGTVFLGIGTNKKPKVNEEMSADDFNELDSAITDIYDKLYALEEQLDWMTGEGERTSGLEFYGQMNAQGSRYIRAIDKALDNLSNFIDREKKRHAAMYRK